MFYTVCQVLVKGEWVESYLVLTATNILDLYQDSSRTIRWVQALPKQGVNKNKNFMLRNKGAMKV
jgi:hypothetical protein